MLHQRCPECKAFFPLKDKACKCGVTPRVRSIYSIKYVNYKRYVKSLGNIPKQRAVLLEAQWDPMEKEPEHLTLGEVSHKYLEKLKAEDKSYHKESRLFLARLIEFLGKDMLAKDVTVSLAREFQTRIRSQVTYSDTPKGYRKDSEKEIKPYRQSTKPISAAYTDRHISVCKAAFNHCMIEPNPFKQVKLYRPDNRLIRYLTTEQESALLECCKKYPHLYPIVLTAVNTGLRQKDILNLHKDEVDLTHRVIRVRTKNGKTHSVPMNDRLFNVLSVIEPSKEGWFFPSPITGKPYDNLRKSFASAKKKAGIITPFRFHDLRHSFAINIGRLTKDINVVKELLGHTDINVTVFHYRHVLDSELREAVALISCETAKN